MPAITVVPVAYISGRHRRFRPLQSTPGLLDRAPELAVSSSPGSLLFLLQFVTVESATASDRRCRIDLLPLLYCEHPAVAAERPRAPTTARAPRTP